MFGSKQTATAEGIRSSGQSQRGCEGEAKHYRGDVPVVQDMNVRYAAQPSKPGSLGDESEARRRGSVILSIGCRVVNGRDARAGVRQIFP